MIIDGLAFVSGNPGSAGDVATLLAHLSELGIDRALICGSKCADGTSPNTHTAAAVGQEPDRLTGLIRLNPWLSNWRADLDRHADGPSFAGVLLHPWEDGFAVLDPEPKRIVERSAEKGLSVTIAAGYPWRSEALQIGALAEQFPDTTFVLSNEGQLNISGLGAADVSLLLGQAGNVVVQTTGAYREDFLVSLVAQYGPERLMYASGYPRFSPEYELRRVQWADGITAQAKDQIVGATAAAVFGLRSGPA
jgi:predicted TIM-barrel fold metal-dependent hydrolase